MFHCKRATSIRFRHFCEQEIRRAYGTAVSGLVIHLNEIHLTLTLTLKVLNPNPNPKSVTCLVGGMLKMTDPNSKSCSKCCKMPKFNFSFLGLMFIVLGYAKMTHPNPKTCSKCCKMPKSNFSFLGVTL